MKKLLATLLILVACIHVNAQESRQIRISTDRTDLILEVAPDGRLYQSYLGDRLLNEQDLKNLSGSSRGWEVYPGSGGEDYFEPAVAITNNDGNLSTILRYVCYPHLDLAGLQYYSGTQKKGMEKIEKELVKLDSFMLF